MKVVSTKSIPLASAAAFLVIISFPTSGLRAQSERGRPNPASGVGGTNASADRQPSINERQLMMDVMAREAKRPRRPSEMERMALTQIAEDFKRIQILNNKMLSAVLKSSTPDYASIAGTTAEIRKRASRLINNLNLPKGVSETTVKRPEHKPTLDAADMKAALLSLDGTIMNFVENQIFQNPNVIDVEQAAKARRDVEIIIESSRLISKDAERLSSLSKKN
jgi:hypothetical protein